MTTIRRQLITGLLCATVLCTAGAGTLLYRTLLGEANELADLQLRQLAVALPDEFARHTGRPAPEDPEEEFSIGAWDMDGHQVAMAPLLQHRLMPRQDIKGFRTLDFDGEPWRVFGIRRHGLYVQVPQPMAIRDRVAAHMAWRAGAPLLVFVVLLIILTLLVVRTALRPLNRLANIVAHRSPSTLDTLDAGGWPVELAPIVNALNAFLERFAHALATQRTFVADAAHELRSPLTALKLQLQLAERETDAGARAQAMTRLQARLDRTSHLVDQLLSLATHDTGYASARMTRIDLQALLEDTVADHSVLADSRAIDLGIAAPTALTLHGHREGLQCLLNNLVDNALRYTQRGGRVDVGAELRDGHVVLVVADDGPGIGDAHLDRIFDRFYRPDGQDATGCGLGLSIVRNIAEHHGAHVALARGAGGRGLTVSVRFAADTG